MAVYVAADVTEDAEDEDAVGEVCPILTKTCKPHFYIL